MYVQKQKELQKQYDKQEKKLKELKAGGKSTKQAVSMAGQGTVTVQYMDLQAGSKTNNHIWRKKKQFLGNLT